jgi:Protein of unknown function (DUF3800)
MPIYCDESGGIGRGVMTLAAVSIDELAAENLLAQFRIATGLIGELKGSRIDLPERAMVFDLLAQTGAQIAVSIAISALKPGPGGDRGVHDAEIYAQLMTDAVGALLPAGGECVSVIMDAGRYDDKILGNVQRDIAALVGPWNGVQLVESHILAGLQIADVIANSFFNRAFVTSRQPRFTEIVQPFLDSGQIKLRLLTGDTQSENKRSE